MLQKLQKVLDDSQRIVFFGGAGVSTESGIPDFRSADGLYSGNHKISPEQILSHSFFMSHTAEFYEFYRSKMLYPDAKPNAAHKKLAEFEKSGRLTAVVTQNIDGLHQAAGSKNVLELHGSVLRNKCTKCGKSFTLSEILSSTGVPLCSCGAVIKPEVVLYEEGLDEKTLTASVTAISSADTLIIAGTSLTVYPAAGLINYFSGKNLILINKSETPADRLASLVIHGSVGEVLGAITTERGDKSFA